ncbi:MAG: hypothetical protein CL763_09060, partial [Chloroflexi bacterium]|nr:hypothetical protein [Chloroflexota bacterium]
MFFSKMDNIKKNIHCVIELGKRLSPLRYPGGKSRAVELITKQYIIPNLSEGQGICSPFFGGGSIELYLSNNGYKVTGYDDFEPLVDFWKVLKENPKKLFKEVSSHKKLSKKGFKELQIQFREKSKSYTQTKRAALFYVLNRTSFSGTTLSGGMAVDYDKPERSLDRRLPRFGKSSRDRIRDFSVKNFTVSKLDFRKSIEKNKNSLIYADPPYFIQNKGSLYGNQGDKMFTEKDHEDLAHILNKM